MTTAPSSPPPLPPFAPKDFEPPFARSASPEDGKWIPIGEEAKAELAAQPPARLFRASVHPHRTSPFKRMDVAALDLRELSLHWTIGEADAGADKLRPYMRPGLIDASLQSRAVAIFNGGFLARHGYWGQMSHGAEVVPPRDIGCTLTIAKAGPGGPGAVKIRPWTEVSDDEEIVTFRQSAPCLLHQGEVHKNLVNGQARLWAGRSSKRKTRRRSAVGIDAAGTTLFYAMGTETEAVDLARGMRAVGARQAMQLDINWNWTRFLLVGRQEGKARVTSTLAKDMAHGKTEYFRRPSKRDFFYLVQVNGSAGTR